jgi:Lysyl oxidase
MKRLTVLVAALAVATCTPGGPDPSLGPTPPIAAQAAALEPDAGGLPDLIVDTKRLETSWHVSDQDLNKQDACSLIEGGVAAGTHRVLRFTVTTPNVGTADLVVGNPLDHVAAKDGLFEFASCHAHFHYRHYATYQLLSASGAPLVIRAAKRGFCMIDVTPWRIEGGGGGARKFDSCGNQLVPGNQGISVGFADSYDKHIGGQYFVLDGADGQAEVPPGDYWLRIEVNPGFTAAAGEPCPVLDAASGLCHNFAESRYDNNVSEVLVTIPDRK